MTIVSIQLFHLISIVVMNFGFEIYLKWTLFLIFS